MQEGEDIVGFLMKMNGNAPVQKKSHKDIQPLESLNMTAEEYMLTRQIPDKPKDFSTVHLPPLLKDASWTRAAPFKESIYNSKTSDSIANNYTPSAARLNMKTVVSKFDLKIVPQESSNKIQTLKSPIKKQTVIESSPPMSPITRIHQLAKNQSMEDLEILPAINPYDIMSNKINNQLSSAEKYRYYIENGIPESQIDTVTDQILKNAFKLVPDALLTNRFLLKYKNAFEKEFKEHHIYSVRKSVLDYILLDVNEQKRLGINLTKPHADIVARGPVPWHASYESSKAALTANLWSLNPMNAKINAIFEDFKSSVTLDFGFVDDSNHIGLDVFVSTLKEQITKIKMSLNSVWLKNIIEVFILNKQLWYSLKGSSKDSDTVRLDAFFNCVASLMTNQIWEMTEKLVTEFECFFSKFEHATSYSSLFKINLDISSNRIRFVPPLSEVESSVISIVEEIVDAFKGIQRIETKLFTSLKAAVLNLNSMDMESSRINQGHLLRLIITRNIVGAQRHLLSYDKYKPILSQSYDKKIEEFLEVPHTLEEFEGEIKKLNLIINELNENPDKTWMSMLFLDCEDLNGGLKDKTRTLICKINDSVAENQRKSCQELCESYETISSNAMKSTTNTDELVELSKYIDNVRQVELPSMNIQLVQNKHMMEFLLDQCHVTDDDMKLNASTFTWISRIIPVLELSKKRIMQRKIKAQEDLKAKIESVTKDVQEEYEQVQKFKDFGILSDAPEYAEKIVHIELRLVEIGAEIKVLNAEEELLEWERSAFTRYAETFIVLEPFKKLCDTAMSFITMHSKWMTGPFLELDSTLVSDKFDILWKDVFKLIKQFAEQPISKKVAETIKTRLEKFKAYLPMISCLRSEGLKERHWEQINALVGKNIAPTEDTTLTFLVEAEVVQFLNKIEAVSEVASKEWGFQKNLVKMHDDWLTVAFTCIDYKDSGTKIISSVDDIQNLLDDHMIKTQTIRGSPLVKAFESEIGSWEATLNTIQETLDELLKVQATWLYLEPIFSSEDIMIQMPVEGRKFKTVDKFWREIVKAISETSSILDTITIPRINERLVESSALLEEIQKGLNEYLEKKRLFFPRFFFLSNDELLEILAETKDPKRVQPHLKKCFEGIESLEFTSDDRIVAMCSSENEKVVLSDIINPELAKGAVEKWLLQVEKVMQSSVYQQIKEALFAYPKTTRANWVLEWPGQVVLAVSQIFWTREMTDVMRIGRKDALIKYRDDCTKQLEQVVALVRGKLSPMARLTLSALVVIDVHARDTVADIALSDLKSEDDFEWKSQLRYYWENDHVAVKMINASLRYGYEYLGNCPRLVITALTDRCYRTLIGALDLNLGGAPEGPAGTGKTETVKDLAKAIAKQCVVFNCSDGLDYIAMGKFFKGLASSGAWACFDEFNRIDLEVLSVVAQQISTIQRAVAAKLEKFVFDGTDISLNCECSVFITMNPGYAGRSELPDNLKVLFRPVAMMVPDYALIAEISLYSYGYIEARVLSKKIVATYRLCSEQLSSQDHYDYGMRAVKAVLTAAGNMKIKYPDENEQMIMLRSIIDVNLPKFLQQDVSLFKAITSDLFPGVTLPTINYDSFLLHIKNNIKKQNLIEVPSFIEKIIQTYEMMCIRHGYMIVGLPWSGKTVTYKVLAAALNDMHDAGLDEKKVEYKILNPKSITMGQLYGQFDPITHEWSDGILANLFRSFASQGTAERKWIVFDGPVDAIWIENMNTVLDDNKKLCLTSGEIMQMTSSMTVQFEVMDLSVASPATVSRCGMIYMEPAMLGWQPLITSWLNILSIGGDLIEYLREIINIALPEIVNGIKNYKAFAYAQDSSLVNSMINIVNTFIITPQHTVSKQYLFAVLYFSCVWSFGGHLDFESRKKFDVLLRSTMESIKIKSPKQVSEPQMPKLNTVYDYFLQSSDTKCEWKLWTDVLQKTVFPSDAKFSDIIIPTVDTVRYAYLLDLLIKNNGNVALTGPTGTGKSVYIKDKLLKGLSKDVFVPQFLNFSAQTKASQVQELIMSKLDKRRKGVYGPHLGQKSVVFVDDLNMPSPEKYGAQPPIELMRQCIDQKLWYELKDMSPINLVDVQFIAAMSPEGGGRNSVTPRLLRHFNILSIVEFDDATTKSIFDSILDWHFVTKKFDSAITSLKPSLIQATLKVFTSAKINLLPTPNKSHYLFNLRDFSRVIQGLLLTTASQFTEGPKMVRLWTHEILRVFGDRLVEDVDRAWLFDEIKTVLKTDLASEINSLFKKFIQPQHSSVQQEDLRSLMFGKFLSPKYDEVADFTILTNFMKSKLEDYNQVSKTPMDLVLFRFAVEHIVRVSRILEQPGGHALLVGVGGSGRQSVIRLSTFMADYELCQVEISKSYGMVEWRDDLKKFLLKAGADNIPCVFLLDDTQIKSESFLEDINNLLNTGEIPNLFAMDEKVVIAEKVRSQIGSNAKNMDTNTLFSCFITQCKDNLHVTLSMSPIGDAFKNRLRMFPSLINCCTVDWFQAWPEDALSMVANKFLIDIIPDVTLRNKLVTVCKSIHVSVKDLSTEFKLNERRQNYVTPTSYLELLHTYKSLLTTKQTEVNAMTKRYESGLEQLASAAEQVGIMSKELNELQPILVITQKETATMLIVVQAESEKVEIVRAAVKIDEAIANKKASEAKVIKDECEGDLAVALPALEAAMEALNTLKKNDIDLVKSMKSPPSAVKMVMEAICIMKGTKPARIKDSTGKMVEDYWGPALKLLGDSHFLQGLKEYDRDNIDPKIIEKIRKSYTSNPEFSPELIKNSSSAAEGLCKWVCALDKYESVAKVVAPKTAALKAAESELSAEMAKLQIKQAELQEVESKIAKLESQFKEMSEKKKSLEEQADMCAKKLIRAEKLLGGLGGEKDRWTLAAEISRVRFNNLKGDILISSGIIAYLGAFTGSYRQKCVQQWIATCNQHNIPSSSTFNLASVLGDQIQIREYVINGLPNDNFSIENSIIADKTRRWPLFIDPQGQANKWIKNVEKNNKLAIIKLSDSNYVRILENGIQFGTPVLLENVGEQLDPILEPLLTKRTFKQGGVTCIKLGDSVIELSPHFKLYITTKLRNPHYLPELSTKVTLTNFVITPDGLEDQLLGIVVSKERPDLEDEKNKLVVASAKNKKQLKEIEDRILDILFNSQGNLLDDETAITALTDSKKIAEDIDAKQKIADQTEKEIDSARANYKPIAIHSATLFFVSADLANIESMYQYSLTWFISLFIQAISNSEKSSDIIKRISHLKSYFTNSMYENICRSLFKKDKTIFSFLLASSIMKSERKISANEWSFFLNFGISDVQKLPNPSPDWITDKLWSDIGRASCTVFLSQLSEHFTAHLKEWKDFIDSTEPHKEDLPEPWNNVSSLGRLTLIKLLRFDKLGEGMTLFVGKNLGASYLEPPPFDLAGSFKDSNCCTPLIFILSPGSDVMTALLKFGESKDFGASKLQAISLGQGQGLIAAQMIKNAAKLGHWIVLQNCHLATSWLSSLEKICDEFTPSTVHKDFRLWLTSYPSPVFPVTILENGIKITNEAPAGLRANLMRSYLSDPISDPSFFTGVDKSVDNKWKKMLFGLCFFHAVIQERRSFGPIGWNISYEFNDSDLRISVKQLQKFIGDNSNIQWKALQYLIGECNYGGRVTDDRDRRSLSSLLAKSFSPEILEDGYSLSESGKYMIPTQGDYTLYLRHITNLPVAQSPEAFGLHENADVTREISNSNLIMDSILSTQSIIPTSSASGQSPESVLKELLEVMLHRIPNDFDMELVQKKYPISYTESMNTVLIQELVRFNRLLSTIKGSLKQSISALKGLTVMSKDIEEVCKFLTLNRVPETWMSKSYPSLKPLGSYIADLLDRVAFFDTWINDRIPVVFWISGFYFTQSFLTGMLQNYSRKYSIPIDLLLIDCKVMPTDDLTDAPEDGVYVRGLFLEGARYDKETSTLAEPIPKKLYDAMPIVHIFPTKFEAQAGVVFETRYECPVYRTSARRGTLSTTGHSTNFVANLYLPTEVTSKHWISRGTAMLLALSD